MSDAVDQVDLLKSSEGLSTCAGGKSEAVVPCSMTHLALHDVKVPPLQNPLSEQVGCAGIGIAASGGNCFLGFACNLLPTEPLIWDTVAYGNFILIFIVDA
ncbi:MAG: hypothetical protein QNJ22_04160 [Desulfosarcinaceae bacterium]|nr:hypothetical protein [Desulfosarcinaceae bacterium]